MQKWQNNWEQAKCQQGGSSHTSCYHRSNVGHGGRITSHTRFPRRDSPSASGRVSATSSAHIQTSFNLVCDSSGIPTAKAPTQTVQAPLGGIPDGDSGTCLSWGALSSTLTVPITCSLRHTPPPCSAISDCAAGVSQTLTSQTSWLGD